MGDKVAIVIPWLDSGDEHRRRAFEYVYNHLKSMDLGEIFIGEADTLNRARMRNNGAYKAIEAGYTKLHFNDADCLITKEQLEQAIKYMSANRVVYPYNRVPVHLTKEQTDRVVEGEPFTNYWNTRTKEVRPGAGNFCCNTDTFLKLGGLDEAFEGWGYEDTDFTAAAHKLYRTQTVHGSVVELYHSATERKNDDFGPASIEGTPEWIQLQRNKLRFQCKRVLDRNYLNNRELLNIVVPALRHGMAERFMRNTMWPVIAVVHNNQNLAVEWKENGAQVLECKGKTFAKKCNYAYTQNDAAYTLYIGEDVAFPLNWSANLHKYVTATRPGVVGTNDLLYSDSTRSTHLIMSRQYIQNSGGSWGTDVPFYEYIHNFPDTEAIAKAKSEDQWIYAPDIQIKHLHYQNAGVEQNEKLPLDKYYIQAQQTFNLDAQTYYKRRAQYLQRSEA